MKYVLGTAVVGFFLVLGLTHPWMGWLGSSTAQAKAPRKSPQDGIEVLRAKIKRLEDVAPDQAHAMISAAYHQQQHHRTQNRAQHRILLSIAMEQPAGPDTAPGPDPRNVRHSGRTRNH